MSERRCFRIAVNEVCPGLVQHAPVILELPLEPEVYIAADTRVYAFCPVGEMEPHAEYEVPEFVPGKDPHISIRQVTTACQGCQYVPQGFSDTRNRRARWCS